MNRRRRGHGRAAAIALCLAASVLAIGCGVDGDARSIRGQARAGFTAQDVADYERRRDEYLIGCMRDAGFAYVPFEPPGLRQSLKLGEQEFAERYGSASRR